MRSTCPIAPPAISWASLSDEVAAASGPVPTGSCQTLVASPGAAVPPSPSQPTAARVCSLWGAAPPAWLQNLQPQLDAETQSVAHPGHLVRLINNGAAGWRERVAMLQWADMVLLRVYEICNDVSGQALVRLLQQQAQRGCTIVIQFDFKGTAGAPRYMWDKKVPLVLAPLALHPNVILVPCHVPRGLARALLPCDHKKFFIALSARRPAEMVLGGMNMGDRYMQGGRCPAQGSRDIHAFRDVDVWVSGPVIGDAIANFLQDAEQRAPHLYADIRAVWRRMAPAVTYAFDGHGGTARLVCNAPMRRGSACTIGALFISFTQHVPAGETIFISNGYFLPLPGTTDAIVQACRRGVRFFILCNSPRSHDMLSRVTGIGTLSLLRLLFSHCPQESLKIWLWGSDASLNLCAMHQKTALFGRCGPVLVGSANMDAVSERSNYESVLLSDDAQLRSDFLAAFWQDVARPNVRRIRKADVLAVPWYLRLWQGGVRHTLGRQL